MPTVVWSNVLSPTTLSSTDTDICTGESVTFTADVPDASDDQPSHQCAMADFFNGDLLGEENLQDYVILDPSIGPSLADWSDSTFSRLRPSNRDVTPWEFSISLS